MSRRRKIAESVPWLGPRVRRLRSEAESARRAQRTSDEAFQRQGEQLARQSERLRNQRGDFRRRMEDYAAWALGLALNGTRDPSEVLSLISRLRDDGLTMVSTARLIEIATVITLLEAREIPGVFVECGTARGGTAILQTSLKSPQRRLYVYDVFGLIPAPTAEDGKRAADRYRTIDDGKASGRGGRLYYGYETDLLGEVERSFREYDVPTESNAVTLIPGLFEDTIDLDETVAFAMIDGDWYASVKVCLERLAPLLHEDGYLYVDDYFTWPGCRKAVDEYVAANPDFEIIAVAACFLRRRPTML